METNEATSTPPPPPSDGVPSKEERQWAMFAHLSALVGGLLTSAIGGWGFFIGPLVIWLLKKDEMPFAGDQAKEALNFNITVSAIFLILLILTILSLGLGAILTGVFAAPSLGGSGIYDYASEAVSTSYSIADQVMTQTLGVIVAVVWSGVVAFIAYKAADLLVGLRVSEEAEREGLDISSHGETAYTR